MSKSAADKVAQAKLEGLVELEPKPKRYALYETPKTAKPTAPRKTAPFKVSPSAALKSYFRKAEVLELMQLAYLEGFMRSGEGFNGEYPFKDTQRNPEDFEEWVHDRYERVSLALDKWLSR